jgi:hypothetical protein
MKPNLDAEVLCKRSLTHTQTFSPTPTSSSPLTPLSTYLGTLPMKSRASHASTTSILMSFLQLDQSTAGASSSTRPQSFTIFESEPKQGYGSAASVVSRLSTMCSWPVPVSITGARRAIVSAPLQPCLDGVGLTPNRTGRGSTPDPSLVLVLTQRPALPHVRASFA